MYLLYEIFQNMELIYLEHTKIRSNSDHCNEKKEEIWIRPMTKAPTTTEKPNKQRDNTQTPPKNSITQRT